MKTNNIIKKPDNRLKKKIIKYGYEYTLVAVSREKASFMNNAGFALKSFKKLDK
jgi:hypothetical protein